MTRHQLRAARALLVLQQEVLAEKAAIGVATLRRFENGNGVGQAIVDALQRAIEAKGVILVASGTTVGGRRVGDGVVLRREHEMPDQTKGRLAAFDLTSEEAATNLSPKRRGKTGRRSRVPLPPNLRRTASDDDGGTSED